MQNEQNFALATLQKRTSMANVAAGLPSHRNSCPLKKITAYAPQEHD